MRLARRKSESGFALLLVFLMAGAVALMLYRQLPRVAFETERDREQLLIDRGEQYRRAIQLFFVANQRYPNTLDELEKYQDKRYLRQRYKDPMTGKDEWRIVHTNGAFLTDSAVTKPPTEQNQQNAGTPGASGPTGQITTTANANPNGQNPDAPAEVNAAVLRRPSDRLQPSDFSGGYSTLVPNNPDDPGVSRFDPNTPISLSGMQSQQNSPQPPQLRNPMDPNAPPMQPGQMMPGQMMPGQIPGIPAMPGTAPTPGQQTPQFRIDANGRFVPMEPATNPGSNFPTATPGGVQQFRNQNSIPQQGASPASNNAAINAINQILTTPRQPNGLPLPGGTTPGAIGIAGVASMSKAPSIKLYKERGKYNEWEFVFDRQQMAQQQQQQQQPANQNPLGGTQGQTGTPAGPPPLFPPSNPMSSPGGSLVPRQ